MTKSQTLQRTSVPEPATLDARLARRLVTPLIGTPVTPNHLTTLRLLIGIAGAYYLSLGHFWACTGGALLIALSNFVDHTDGELARISGKSSKIGHFYDLGCDALVTILLFVGIGFYVSAMHPNMPLPGEWLGAIAGIAVALIFFLRMRIEQMIGKSGTQQAKAAGFETEDVLYLLPLVTVLNGMTPFLLASAVGAPLYALWCGVDYWRATRRTRQQAVRVKRVDDTESNDFQAVQ
jgi:phosphatidylglycerophosphate synthase